MVGDDGTPAEDCSSWSNLQERSQLLDEAMPVKGHASDHGPRNRLPSIMRPLVFLCGYYYRLFKTIPFNPMGFPMLYLPLA